MKPTLHSILILVMSRDLYVMIVMSETSMTSIVKMNYFTNCKTCDERLTLTNNIEQRS